LIPTALSPIVAPLWRGTALVTVSYGKSLHGPLQTQQTFCGHLANRAVRRFIGYTLART
jgi:hypothetical protein